MTQAPHPDTLIPNGSLPFSRILVEGSQDLFGVESLALLVQELPSRAHGQALARCDEAAEFSGASISAEDTRSFSMVLEKIYGPRSGRGLSMRVGRLVYNRILKYFGETYGLLDSDYRLLPVSDRMETGLRRLAMVFNQQFGEHVTLQDQASHWLWTAEDCLNCCHGNASADCACYLMVGILQEFLSWASGSRFYPVVELECAVSDGKRCVFRIDKKPLD